MKKVLVGVIVLGVIIAVLFAALLLSSDVLIQKAITEVIGAEVTIGHVLINPATHTLILKDFRVYNPHGFNIKELLAYLPEIRGVYNLDALLRDRKLHFLELSVYMKSLMVEKDIKNKLNIDSLKVYELDPKDMPLRIDNLNITVDKVVYKEILKNGKPRVEIYEVNIKNQNFKDIPNVQQVVAKVIVESIRNTKIKSAAIFGAATTAGVVLAGPLVIPAAAAIILTGKDSYYTSFDTGYDTVYNTILQYAKNMNKKIHEDKRKGFIKGKMSGASVIIKVIKDTDAKTTVGVSARKFLLPAPRIAGGILYEITQKIETLPVGSK